MLRNILKYSRNFSSSKFIGRETWEVKEKYLQNKIKINIPKKTNKLERETWEIREFDIQKIIIYNLRGIILSKKK